MAKYTEEQKHAVLARIPEIGMSEAAKEAGIPVSTVSKWNKAAKTGQARDLYAKAEKAADAAVVEAFVEADAKLAEAQKEAQAIVDQAEEESAEALKEAIEEKKEEIKDKVDATKIEKKKNTRSAGRKMKEKAKEVKTSVEAKVEDAVVVTEIEAKKKTAKASRKATETRKTVKEKIEKPVKKVKAAKVDMIFETNGGRQIKPEEIAERVPKGVDAAYVKLEDNKIYWVKGTETGSVDIWE